MPPCRAACPSPRGRTQGTTTAVINVADTRQVLDVNVKFDISHTFDGDLNISFESALRGPR